MYVICWNDFQQNMVSTFMWSRFTKKYHINALHAGKCSPRSRVLTCTSKPFIKVSVVTNARNVEKFCQTLLIYENTLQPFTRNKKSLNVPHAGKDSPKHGTCAHIKRKFMKSNSITIVRYANVDSFTNHTWQSTSKWFMNETLPTRVNFAAKDFGRPVTSRLTWRIIIPSNSKRWWRRISKNGLSFANFAISDSRQRLVLNAIPALTMRIEFVDVFF